MLAYILEKYRALFANPSGTPDAKTAALRGREIFFYADFNLGRLLALARRLRNRPCTCNERERPKAGAFNFVILLTFDDGVEWVFRAPSSRYAAPQGDPGRILASEAATLKYIRENASVPVPEVFAYSDAYDNEIGLPYILMSKAPGRPLATFEWQTHPHRVPRDSSATAPALTREEKAKVLGQLGRHARQLSALRFPAIGSVFEGEKGYYIDECLHPGYVLGDRTTLDELPRGPFRRAEDYYFSLAAALRLHVERLPMGHHVLRAPVPAPQEYDSFEGYCAATDRRNDFAALGGRVDSRKNRLEYCLVSHLLQDLVIPRMAHTRLEPGFPLCHHDISLENVFVDEDLNITCVIDWSFCSTVPQAQLLAIPGLPHVRDLIAEPPLVAAFHSGFEAENKRLGGRAVEARDWEAGEVVSRFMRVVNLDALQDHAHLEALWRLLWGPEASGDDEDAESLSNILATWATVQESLTPEIEMSRDDDEEEARARREEKEYFDTAGVERLALARKVALAAEMNLRFVADKRLWRWIGEAMDHGGDAGSSVPGADAPRCTVNGTD